MVPDGIIFLKEISPVLIRGSLFCTNGARRYHFPDGNIDGFA